MAPNTAAPAYSSDGKALSKLAQKVPSPKKSGNIAMDQRLQVEHDAMVWVIDRLSKNPQEACHIQTYMLSRAFSQALSPTSTTWTGSYKTLECLPKAFMLKYLLQRLDALKVTTVSAETLKALELADANHIPTLFSMDLQLPLSVSVPLEMLDTETTCMQILVARAEKVGDRLRHFAVKGGFATPGSLDMKAGGSYTLVWEGDSASRVSHISGSTVPVPPHAAITKKFVLKDNDGDWKAVAELSPSSYHLYKYFPADSEFLKAMYLPGQRVSVLKAHVQKVLCNPAALTAKPVSESASHAAEAALQEAGNAKRQECLKRARAKLEESQTKRKAARTIVYA